MYGGTSPYPCARNRPVSDGVPNASRLEPSRNVAFNKSMGFGVQAEPLLAISETLTVTLMSPLRARVEKGRLVLDEPTTLPEGTIVDLVADDEGDDLTDEERRALHEALSVSWKSAESGRLRPASEILDKLRRGR
jgi:hypothetical protein